MISSNRPNGPRLTLPTDIKIKGLQIQRQPDEPTMTLAYSNWRWDANIRPQIDIAVDILGANCIKWASSAKAVTSGAITRTQHLDRMRQIIEYAADKSSLIYWCTHFNSLGFAGESPPMDTDEATLEEVVAAAAVLAEYQHVIGNDVCNEPLWNSTVEAALANHIAGYEAIKAVAPRLPLTTGLFIDEAVKITGTGGASGNLADFAPYTDFWDFHLYYGSGDPAPTDFEDFRADENYKPFLVGECGQVVGAGTIGQAARWHALGLISAEPDCFGVVGYTTQDLLTGSTDYALYSQDYRERTHMTSEFRDWPGRR